MTGVTGARALGSCHGAEFDRRSERVAEMTGIDRAAADSSTWTVIIALLRTLIGAAFIDAISDGMLLGQWYLTQPGLPRRLLNEMVTALACLW